jgi:hypothetical protein
MAVTKSICLECMQKYTGWATSDICPDCNGKLIPLHEFSIPDKPIKINNEFTITHETHLISPDEVDIVCSRENMNGKMFISFMLNKNNKHGYGSDFFWIEIDLSKKNINIGTAGDV